VRLENRYDGVPGLTQEAVEPGQTFRYQIYFKDAGIYWYHPHHREDVQQELGLAGNILVTPISTDYYSPVNREEVVMLDDLVLTQDGTVPFGLESSNYMLMGRFGNLFITNGEPEYSLEINAGEVVRFHFTNASNTRTFNISFRPRTEPDANVVPIKVVGSDVGKLEHEVIVESIVLAPAERYVVEVFFDKAGSYELTNHVQGINHRMGVFLEEISILGTITVSEFQTAVDHHQAFETLRTNLDVIADIDRYRSHFDRPVDHELVLTLEVDSLPPAIEQSMLYDWVYFNPVEWTGTMPVMNWSTTGAEVEWILRDAVTGDENTEVNWSFQVGDVVKIRIHNDRGAFHSMQHPLHIHGQRFLILEQNGAANNNLVWKDTVLLPAGSSTDILLELSNPGRWMVHCHIAEHLESGMKFVIDVEGN
jgi:FtsP/CotA-like multicopper oxidase with cupredoxin domain